MNKFIDELTMASYESEIDLDRDVPGDLAFLEHQNMVDEDEVDSNDQNWFFYDADLEE